MFKREPYNESVIWQVFMFTVPFVFFYRTGQYLEVGGMNPTFLSGLMGTVAGGVGLILWYLSRQQSRAIKSLVMLGILVISILSFALASKAGL